MVNGCLWWYILLVLSERVFFMDSDVVEKNDSPRPANRIYFVLLWFFGGTFGLHFLYLKKYVCCGLTLLGLIMSFVLGEYFPFIGPIWMLFVIFSGFLFYSNSKQKMRFIGWSLALQLTLVVLLFFAVPFFLSFGHQEKHKRYMCQARLKQIGICIQLYQMDYKQFPDKLESLRQTCDFKDDDLKCPITGEKFIYSVPAAPKEKVFPLAYDSLVGQHRGGSWVLWSDGEVLHYTNPDKSGKFATVEELFDYAEKEHRKIFPEEKDGSQ